MTRVLVAPVVFCALALSACSTTIPGEPNAPTTGPPVSPTSAAAATATTPQPSPRPLPFVPKIKDRTNDRNNQTTFEPCTAYTDDELRRLNIDPSTMTDAPQADSPNYRGCRWNSVRSSPRDRDYLEYSQIVGKRQTLEEYRRDQSYRNFREDRIVLGRRIVVSAMKYDCSATFEVEATTAVTIVQALYPSPNLTRECDAAIALASLGVSKAP